MKKRVYRFHAHVWTDIVIEVDDNMNDEECFELANDKYNEGDYEVQDENFENTDCEEVTDYYEENEIPC